MGGDARRLRTMSFLEDADLGGQGLSERHQARSTEPIWINNYQYQFTAAQINIWFREFCPWYVHIYDNDVQHGVNYERIVANLPNLNKLVIKSKRPIQVIDLTCWGFIKTFQNTAFEFASEAVFTKGSGKNMEEHDNILNFESQVEEAWDIMKNLHCDMPWGPSDVKHL
ncbi:hypothetical protein NQ318_007933 [Aromia moschata]|uniref:Uncharacterized protein n=1 Tax=Aromia moschata TaxID=1265417 RepID=A0AAV8Y1Z4_9CUCU|nr:hypothetical protein NQ318_007933 [Aromia moschata]